MTGAIATDIKAFAIPLHLVGAIADHTYVESGCGFTWECFGRAAGGREVVCGTGNSFASDCISYPRDLDHWVYAGLQYFTDGVCHQAANRLLFPAGALLDNKTRGYAVSVVRYSQYGLRAWRNLGRCIVIGNQGRLVKSMSGYLRRHLDVSDYNIPDVTQIPLSQEISSMNEFDARKAETTVRLLLGDEITKSIGKAALESLTHKQLESWKFQQELINKLETYEINSSQFRDISSREHKSTLSIYHDILGPELYMIVFGEAGHQPESIIDPQFFEEQ